MLSTMNKLYGLGRDCFLNAWIPPLGAPQKAVKKLGRSGHAVLRYNRQRQDSQNDEHISLIATWARAKVQGRQLWYKVGSWPTNSAKQVVTVDHHASDRPSGSLQREIRPRITTNSIARGDSYFSQVLGLRLLAVASGKQPS